MRRHSRKRRQTNMQNKRIDTFIMGMAVVFMGAAVFIMGLLPWLGRVHATTVVTMDGKVVEAKPYTPLEERGRKVYIREGCWYCHSQYVRPVTGEDRRWGPASQEGEYAFDVPHMFGTRRIGPDLTREGGRVHDDWHFAHHFNPRMVVPDSIMPRFPWLYKGVDANGKPIPTDDAIALVAYIQKLGTNLGPWRKNFLYVTQDRPSRSFRLISRMAFRKAESFCASVHRLPWRYRRWTGPRCSFPDHQASHL